MYPDILSPFEKTEIFSYQQIYFIGQKAAQTRGKISGTNSFAPNLGFDDPEGSYNHITHDQVAYRYEVLRVLGKGSFGQVLKVFDHKKQEFAALKIIRNDKKFEKQARRELKILEHLLMEDSEGSANVVHMKNSFMFRNHACIVFELMSLNLYELIKKNRFQSFDTSLVRNFSHSILLALSTLSRARIIHGDLKPENILLKQPGKSGLKVIDFGSSCYEGASLYSYVQSRFYRAPEVILGAPYTCAIDMWSLGCIVTELLTGLPLLPGEEEQDQMALCMELLGLPPPQLISRGRRSHKFFTSEGQPRYCQVTWRDGLQMVEGSSSGKGRYRGPPGSRDLRSALRGSGADLLCLDFIGRCLAWEPERRMTPAQALRHAWLRGRRQ